MDNAATIAQLLPLAQGITCDSRQVGPGCIFVAVRGHSADGNAFAAEAARRGALAIVSDRPTALPPLAIPVVPVADARRALAELAAAHRRYPSRDLALVGVTGTNGKTTVACMLEHIFRHAGFTAGLIGTVGVKIGAAALPSALTTPDAATLQSCLAAMRDAGVSHAAMEVSAQGLHQHRVHAISFACGVVTNIGPDHLDFPGGYPAYIAAKQSFPATLAPGAPLIVNAGDPLCRAMAAAAGGPVVTCAVDQSADFTARVTRLASGGSAFTLAGGASLLEARLPLPGRHNVENALLATAAASACGIAPAIALRALAAFRGVPRRFAVARLAGLTVVDDTALNPGSIDAVFRTIGDFTRRRLVVAFAIRGRRGPAINVACAAALARCWRQAPFTLVVTAADGGVGPLDTVADEEKSAFCEALDKAGIPYEFCETLATAIDTLADAARPGDLVALLGAQGMDDGYRLLGRRLAADDAAGIPPAVDYGVTSHTVW